MYCKQCGRNIDANSKFCQYCGADLSSGAPSRSLKESSSNYGSAYNSINKVDSNQVLLRIKPTFISSVKLFAALPIILFAMIWTGGFFGGFSNVPLQALGLGVPVYLPFIFFAMVGVLVSLFFTYWGPKKAYRNAEYVFYPNRLEYNETFLAKEKKTVRYKNITDISLRKGIIQGRYNLGTIYISTKGWEGNNRSGIRLSDIPNPDFVYSKLEDILDLE